MIKKIIKRIAYKLGIGIVSSQTKDELVKSEEDLRILESEITDLVELIHECNFFKRNNKSQINQDIFVLLATNFKRDGYFVEFGATNGVDLSNTFLLEKSYGWKGLLAEPAKVWHDDLIRNRDADIDFSCVWRESDKTISFNMVDDPELSTITEFSDRDFHSASRDKGVFYDVRTISLNDLLEKHNAPRKIDFLSIDTEGSEFEILNSFDFEKYEISLIFCEHNFTDDRSKIFEFLRSKGYKRRFTFFSKFDDWYFKE